jgi:predicted DNA-binding transcriptional regulator AlpA
MQAARERLERQHGRLERLLLSDDDLHEMGIRHSRAQRKKLIAKGLFPRPVKSGMARSTWRADTIFDWLEALPEVSDDAA